MIFLSFSLIHSKQGDSAKNAKIQLALQKLEQASIRRLFVKAFTVDGASKSLLVDENMSCGHVTRLLADKNHVQMEPHWALVEHLPELQMGKFCSFCFLCLCSMIHSYELCDSNESQVFLDWVKKRIKRILPISIFRTFIRRP